MTESVHFGPGQGEGTELFRASETRKKESVEIETPKGREKRRENIVEIPIPESSGEAMNSIVIDSPEPPTPSSSVKNTQSRQTLQKERMPKKEKNEDEVNRDVVIRRILEEFMA